MGNIDFDAATIEPSAGFAPIAPGIYDAIIASSERKASSKGNDLLSIELQIINGPMQNRKIFDNLNMWHPDEQTRTIARGTFSAICRAVNVASPKQSEELHDKPMSITVGVRKRSDTGEMQNNIKKYAPRKAVGVNQPSQPFVSGQSASQTSGASSSGKPW